MHVGFAKAFRDSRNRIQSLQNIFQMHLEPPYIENRCHSDLIIIFPLPLPLLHMFL